MPLPKINTPTYELELPSIKKKIRYRPFLVKEEKILIIAMESEDMTQITNAIKTVIGNCILSRGIKVEKLSIFDIEYLFLNVRGKSVGEEVEVPLICPDDEKTQVSVVINLDDIKIKFNENHSKDIVLDKKLSIKMKYPSLDEFVKSNFNFDGKFGIEESFQLIASSVDQIYENEESFNSSDFSKEEMLDFIEHLTSKQFKEVENFFETMPKLSHTVKLKNPNTGVESDVVLEGLSDFFV